MAEDFLKIFPFEVDSEKPGRVISSVNIGDVSMARIVIRPGAMIGNHYHKKSRMMIYVGQGEVLGVFEDIVTKERKEMHLTATKEVIHSVEHVAHAFKNVGTTDAVLVVFSNRPLRSGDSYPYPLIPTE